MMIFMAVVSFILHPIQFVKDMLNSNDVWKPKDHD